MIALLAIALMGQLPQPRLFLQPNSRGLASAPQPPYLAFAPTSGAGMGTTCACTTPTGAGGEAVTFTRASSGTCLKGSTLSGIANGDLVTCSTDQARVMPGGNGSGGLGLLKEGAATNTTLRSDAFDNASWLKLGVGGGATPTVTANAAVGPDGTQIADRVTFGPSTGVLASILDQSSACNSSATIAESIFVRAVYDGGLPDGGADDGGQAFPVIDLCVITDTATYSCADCSFTSGSWTRCTHDGVVTAGAGGDLFFGSAARENGGLSRLGADVYVAGAQCTSGTVGGGQTSSYIATAGSTVARALDAASISLTWPISPTISAAATVVSPSAIIDNLTAFMLRFDANNSLLDATSGGKNRATFRIGGSNSTQDSAGSWSASAANRVAAYYDGTNKGSCVAGACASASASLTLPSGSAAFRIGEDDSAGGHNANGVVKLMCVDPSSSRCR